MGQAICTRYIAPTNYYGARIRVRAEAGRLFVPWDHELNVYQNHEKAAMLFAKQQGWLAEGDRLYGGSLPDDDGYCFVLVSLPVEQRGED